MKILITGSTGFVGTTLIPYLCTNGIDNIALLVRNKEKANLLFNQYDVEIIEIDNAQNWRDDIIAYNADIVLHLAACFNTKCDVASAKNIVDSNIVFTTLLLEAISNTDCSYFINVGTFAEYLFGAGEKFANSLYSASKSAVRPIIQFYQTQSQFKWINTILYTSYGRKNESKKVIDYMVDALDAPKPVNFSKGEQIFDFVHVDDIANFFLTLITKIESFTADFTELHLGTGKGYSIREVAAEMEGVFNKKLSANWGGLSYRKNDAMYAVAPIGKNIELLGWRAQIDIQEGLMIFKESLQK